MRREMRLNRVFFRLMLPAVVALFVTTALAATGKSAPKKVERWGIFELSLTGPSGGNPFVDVELSAEFKQNGRVFKPGGFYDGDGEPWKWISVGDKPIDALEGLRSFTITGWANPSGLKIGRGGNRIAFNLNYNRSGFDLVCLQDGRLRLAVNEWPDRISNDSSPRKLRIGRWTFFALTYDSTKVQNNIHWYFGDADTPAQLDRTTTYNRGPTGKGSGTLTVGNYNETIQRHGKDRQFRGRLRRIQVFGSRIGPRGALSLSAIRKHQQERKPQF